MTKTASEPKYFYLQLKFCMRFYHDWNVKSHSPCFSAVAEFPCPVAFLTACWERECLVIHAARAEALGGWNSVGAAVLSVCRLNPIIPVGTSETHCLSEAWHWCIVSSENHCPLTPKLCWMCKTGDDASPARIWKTEISTTTEQTCVSQCFLMN